MGGLASSKGYGSTAAVSLGGGCASCCASHLSPYCIQQPALTRSRCFTAVCDSCFMGISSVHSDGDPAASHGTQQFTELCACDAVEAFGRAPRRSGSAVARCVFRSLRPCSCGSRQRLQRTGDSGLNIQTSQRQLVSQAAFEVAFEMQAHVGFFDLLYWSKEG